MEILDYRQSSAQEAPQPIKGLFWRPSSLDDDDAQRAFKKEWGLITKAWEHDAGADEAAALADEINPESPRRALATGPVVIQATDEQARRILECHGRDAFLPQ
jgi:hypothetical protein